MVANVKKNIDQPETTPRYRTLFENCSRAATIRLGLFLHTLSTKILNLADHQIVNVRAQHVVPYTGPTYGKIANTTRQIIAGKIAHEKGYTGNTGWLYATIASLINRHTNTLVISIPKLIIETGLSKSTLLEHTIHLEHLGLIHVDRKRSGPKSSEINTYSLIGEGADITLWNGGTKKIAQPKQGYEKNTGVVRKTNGKDSVQTNPKQPAVAAVAAVKKEKHAPEEIELSPRQQAAVNALKTIKIATKVASALVLAYQDDDNLERLFATIKHGQTSSSLRNPPGFVRDEITNNEQGLSWDIVGDGWQSLESFVREYMPKSPEDYNNKPQSPPQITNTPPAMYDRPAGPELPPLPEVDPHVKEQWTIAYNQLELQFDRATFDTWLKGAKIAGYENDVFIIAVRNSYVRDMLQHRLYRNIRRVLSDVRRESTELRFVVHVTETKKQDDDRMPLFRRLAQEDQRE